jgi:hypothetical protein
MNDHGVDPSVASSWLVRLVAFIWFLPFVLDQTVAEQAAQELSILSRNLILDAVEAHLEFDGRWPVL